jgi:hypothetical protein
MNKSLDWSLFEEYVGRINDLWETEAWQKANHRDKTNGLSQKAVNSYRREHPGSKLQTAVTTKPSKLKKGSKAAKRRKSFCARMGGNKGPMKKPNGKPTPKALALRRWNCESIEQMAQMIARGEQMIAEIKKGAKDSNGFTKCWPGKHAAGTKKGKNGGQVRNCVPNESVNEMDKSQKGPPGWNISDDEPGGKEHYVKAVKSKDVAKNAFTSLNKEMNKTHTTAKKKGVPNESMMPSSSFVGSKKNKINGKGMMKATADHARPGVLVGGG